MLKTSAECKNCHKIVPFDLKDGPMLCVGYACPFCSKKNKFKDSGRLSLSRAFIFLSFVILSAYFFGPKFQMFFDISIGLAIGISILLIIPIKLFLDLLHFNYALKNKPVEVLDEWDKFDQHRFFCLKKK